MAHVIPLSEDLLEIPDGGAISDLEMLPTAEDPTVDPEATISLAGDNFMPGRWKARTKPVSASRKDNYIGLRWKTNKSLSWYRGDRQKKRGFEPQIQPHPNSSSWSTYWAGGDERGRCLTTSDSCNNKGSWATNLPRPYQDDLSSDGSHPNFSIGTANGRALKRGEPYFEAFLTNRGSKNTGTAILSGQAVRRARLLEIDNRGYCLYRNGQRQRLFVPLDKYCMFGEATRGVDTYPVDTSYHYRSWP